MTQAAAAAARQARPAPAPRRARRARLARWPAWLGIGVIALCWCGVAPAQDSSLECNAPTTLTPFGHDGRIGAKWNAATSTVAYGRTGANGYYHTFVSNADGSNERRVNWHAWRDDRHQFPVAWHPSGRYLVMTVEKNEHERSSVDATPGYGAYTDYWLVTPDGQQAWKLYDLPAGYDHAITHAAFSPDGSKFVWTERIKAPRIFSVNLFAGAYEFNVADFVAAPEPHLANVRHIIPGGVDQGGEVESIAGDNKTIAFYSTYVSKNLFASRIYTMDIDSGVIHELTTRSFAQAPTFSPDGRSIVYMTGDQADFFRFHPQGADWWIMNVDGSNKRRLTFMNVRGNPQSVGRFRLAGSLSFTSNTSFFGDVMTRSLGLVGGILKVDCH